MPSPPFRCKKFLVNQEGAAHPVGTDSILLGAWADISRTTRVLDIGTGTGIIALMLAQRIGEQQSDFQIDAVEIHAPSATLAGHNFAGSPWAAHLHVFENAVQELEGHAVYDLIVSNPPFFTETVTAPEEARRNARSTQTLSLSDLAETMMRLLKPEGKCAVILPVQEGRRFYEIAACTGLYLTKITEITTKPGKKVERLLLQLEKSPYSFQRDKMVMFDQNDQRSEVYQQLAGDFYLDW